MVDFLFHYNFFLFLCLRKTFDDIHEYKLPLNRGEAWMCLQRQNSEACSLDSF